MAEAPKGGDCQRRRLQKLFEHANKAVSKDDYDYATELLTQCVLGDPGNVLFVQTLLGNLRRKYQNNKKGASLAMVKTAGTRGLVKKAALRKQWDSVLKSGLEILKVNPWDSGALVNMAEAARELGLDEVELIYLRSAWESDPKDVGVNRLCAHAWAERRQFDQAIACWRRVLQARPKDEEAQKAIGDLAVEKTIAVGGYEDQDAGKKAILNRGEQPADVRPEETDEQRLMRLIRKNPSDVTHYIGLANLFAQQGQFDKAEKVLIQADTHAPGDAHIRARLEDLRLTRLQHQATELQKKAEKAPSPELERECAKLQSQIAQQEIEFFKKRCQQSPTNLTYRFELGLRYECCEQFKEAIMELQRAKLDPRRKGVCDLALGRCFQRVNQPALALEHFAAAATEIPDHDLKNKKLALYLAGTTAMSLQKREPATRYLTNLAGLEYGYRDVAALLDKLAQFSDDES